MSTIVLIRPGETDYDEQSRLLGTLEMPLNDAGLQKVTTIVRHLQQKDIRLECIYTSPVDPACRTARAIAEALNGLKVKEVEELRNVDQGLWQGLPEADVRKRYPQFFRNGKEKPQTIRPPEGETLGDACERIQKIINKAIRKFKVLALVVPDPIASVIRCTLQERGIAVACCLSGENDRDAVECFETEGFEPEYFVNCESKETTKLSSDTVPRQSVK